MTTTAAHTTVLLDEAVDALLAGAGDAPAGQWVDATFGRGGHSRRILSRLSPQGRLLAFDKDPEAIQEAARIQDARFSIRHEGFRHLADLPVGSAAGVLMDLGVSSPQIDTPERGFSFRFDGPLDMRMDPESGESAAQWLAHASEKEIADVLWMYGDERQSRRIARAIVARRGDTPLLRTAQLADLIASVMPRGDSKIHPATRSFQAIRIYINRELVDLEAGLDAALEALKPGGRLAVISFHSLEDRIVKQFMAKHAKAPPANRRMPIEIAFTPTLRLIDGAQKAGDAELATNPRARSAVLRVAEKLQVAA